MRSVSRSSGVARCQTSRQRQIGSEELLLAIALSQPQRHRAHVLPPEGLPTRRDPLRPQRRELPRRSLHRGRRQLLVMSLHPKTIGHTHLADRPLTMLQCNSLLSHLLAISRKLSFSSRVEYAGCLENDNACARPHRPCCGLLAQPLVGCFSPVVHYDADS